ncbi:MAG: NAD(P)-dependent oxidoreductase [Planctomycetota bacterium]
MTMRVLLTGSTGFVGRACRAKLSEAGVETVVTARSVAALGEVAGSEHAAAMDATDVASVGAVIAEHRPTHLLHLAWRSVSGDIWRSAENFAWHRHSVALMTAFAEGGGRRIVGCGTCGEYDWATGMCEEGVTPQRPNTAYGRAKLATCQAGAALADAYDTTVAWGRVFFVYGPGEAAGRLIPTVVDNLLDGQTAEVSHGMQLRDYMHVADVAGGLVAMLGSDVGGAVNVATGQAIRVRDLVAEAADQIGRPELVAWGAKPTGAHEPPLIVAKTERLTDVVGFAPAMDLSAGVADVIDKARAARRDGSSAVAGVEGRG